MVQPLEGLKVQILIVVISLIFTSKYVFEVADYEFKYFEGVACEDGGRTQIFNFKFFIFNSNFFLIKDIDF